MAQGIFEDQTTSGVGGGVSPQQAVAPAPSAVTSIAQGGLLQGIGAVASSLFDSSKDVKKQNLQTTQDAVSSQYARRITALNAAVAQGTRTQADAQREQRALYNTLVANYPQVTDHLTDLNNKLASADGLGDTLSKGTAVDQQIQEDTKKATAAGFINPGMPADQQQSALNSYRQQQHALNQMDFQSKQLGITQQKLSIQSSQESIAASRVNRANAAMDLQLKRNKLRIQQATSDVASTYFTKTRSDLDQLQQDLASGKIDQATAIQRANDIGTNFQALTMPIRGAAGSDYVDGLTKPIADLIQTQKDVLSGKLTQDMAQSKLDALNVKTNLSIMEDPTLAKIMSINKLTNSVFNPALIAAYGNDMVKFVGKGADKTQQQDNLAPSDANSSAQAKTYLDTLRESTRNLSNQDPRIDDHNGTFQEAQNHANQVLTSVGDFASAQKNPAQLNNVMDYFASPEFYTLQKMGAKFDPSAVQGAENAVTTNYNDKLIPAVRDEWKNANTVLSVSKPIGGFPQMGIVPSSQPASAPSDKTPNVVQYSWTGNSLTFRPAPGYEKNIQVLSKVRDLQKTVAPLVTRSTLAAAHMQGSNDYTKYFKQNEAAFFGTDPADLPEGTQ